MAKSDLLPVFPAKEINAIRSVSIMAEPIARLILPAYRTASKTFLPTSEKKFAQKGSALVAAVFADER